MSDQLPGERVPKITIRWWDFSGGQIFTAVVVIVGLVGSWYTLSGQVATATDALADLKTRMPAVERRLDLLELTTANDRAIQQEFQSQMLEALKGIEQDGKAQQQVNSQVLQQLAGIIARLDERGMGLAPK